MLKILHLNNFISYTSGVTRYIYNIIKNTKNIYEHEILCLAGNAVELFKELNVKVTVLNNSGSFQLLGIYVYLRSYCKNNQFDIIHNHHRIFDTVTSMLPRHTFKSVTSIHSKVYGRKILSYKADRLISVSDSITNHLIQYYKKSPTKIKRMVTFVDKSDVKILIEKDELKKHLSLTENKVIMFIGRFSAEKGVDILVQAFVELCSLNKEVLLIMIGEGEKENFLRNYFLKNQLPVLLLKPQINIYDYYNIADLIVLPSRVDPFPFVMLETGLMNKPFIGSDVDGIPELIKHKFNGVLFPSENVNELVKSFQMILKDKFFSERIAQNLHNEIIAKYTVKKVIPDYIEFYNSLV